jgi:hypothetical protein
MVAFVCGVNTAVFSFNMMPYRWAVRVDCCSQYTQALEYNAYELPEYYWVEFERIKAKWQKFA